MNVLVDTPVWSLALRRKAGDLSDRERSIVDALAELMGQRRARIIGLVRQEVLSGIKSEVQFEALRDVLRGFADEPVDTEDHETAAQNYNSCRSLGITVSLPDMLICAVAQRRRISVFTTDPDFERYARVLDLKLHRREV